MARPILETLGQLRRGSLLPEMSDRLAELVKAVESSGRGGKLTLTLTVKPAGKGRVRNVIVEDEVSCKMPPPDRESTIFFPSPDGGLVRNDPNQPELPLVSVVLNPQEPPREVVDKGTGEIRQV